MLGIAWAQASRHLARSLAVVLAIVVASVSFALLSSAVASSKLEVHGTVDANFQSAYDILIRPKKATSSLERSKSLVQENYLAGLYGGISMKQLRQVRTTPDVEVAAPIAMIGYTLPAISLPVRLDQDITSATDQVLALRPTWTTDRGLSTFPDTVSYLYYTRRPTQWFKNQTTGSTLRDPVTGKLVAPCQAFGDNTLPPRSAFDLTRLAAMVCQGSNPPQQPGRFLAKFPRGHSGLLFYYQVPMLIAAIDPVAEAKLVGLDQTVVQGRYLTESDKTTALSVGTKSQPAEELKVPVLMADHPLTDDRVTLQVQRLDIPDSGALPHDLSKPSARAWLARQPGTTVQTLTFDDQQVYQQVLAKYMTNQANTHFQYWRGGLSSYQTGPGGCYASDLDRHSAGKSAHRLAACLSGWEVVAGVESEGEQHGQRERCEEAEAASAAQREVRVVGIGVDRSGHPGRGRVQVQGRPVHGGHGLQDRQAGGAGRARSSASGTQGPDRGAGRAGRGPRGDRPAPGHGDRAGGGPAPARGKSALGLTAGAVPGRVDAATKTGLLDLVDHAVDVGGWSRRRACRLLDLDEDRAISWQRRRELGGPDGLVDQVPGGGAVHGLLDYEREAILELFEVWGGVDRSHRKLAHRGSRLKLVHVSESTVRRVLAGHGLILPGTPAREPAERRPWPDWLEWKPNRIWAYDFTHFTRAKRCAVAVLDMVSRKWVATLVSPEETSTQVEVCFLAALEAEGLLQQIDDRDTAQLRAALLSGQADQIEQAVGDGQVPLLLAVSDNGPQMRSHSTREFLAGVHIAQHFGRPHTPTDQAWIETLFGHVKGEWPHLEKITDPGDLDAELTRVRDQYNGARLHASIGYVTPDDEHDGRGDAIRKARRDGLEQARHERLDHHRRSRGQ